jgi:hypothetical protein
MHSETFRLWNHPSHHRKERDDAALLTQEGNSPAFKVTLILSAEPNLDSSDWPELAIR